MIKRYIYDISCILLVALTAFILAGKPAINPHERPDSGIPVKASPAAPINESKGIMRQMESESDLPIKERNIFAATGSYTEFTAKQVSDNPYNLIAVLQGKEKKAVFRDDTGQVSMLPVGKKLIDGFAIVRIDNLSVQLKRGSEQKDLQLFNAGGNPPPTADKGGALPKNFYTLIGILGGKEQKAVFRDFKGNVSILSVGAKLVDGAIITAIDSDSVKLKKGKERSELRIFDIRRSEQAIRKKS